MKRPKTFYIAREKLDNKYAISATILSTSTNGLWFNSKTLRHLLSSITQEIMGIHLQEGKVYKAKMVIEEI